MPLRFKVCALGEVAPGEARGFTVPGVSLPVMVVNVDGTYFATSSMCPHEDVSLLGCKRNALTVICRGHGYRFDLATGGCSHDPRLTLRRYPVTIVGDEIYVDLL